MKKTFPFNNEIIFCEEDKINPNEIVITLQNELTLNGWVVDKTIVHTIFPSTYMYNVSNYYTIKLTDCNGICRLIKMYQEVYVTFQLSKLSERDEFKSIDWDDYDKKDLIQKIQDELDKLNEEPNRINKLIEYAKEFELKLC